jgi:hypothetical protein
VREAKAAQQKAGQGRHHRQDNHDRSEQVIGAPSLISRSMSAATRDAVTAAVAPSGPAMAKGRELRTATMAALIVVVTKVAAIP